MKWNPKPFQGFGLRVYDYIGKMEKKMEATIIGIGVRFRVWG